jgi:pimeloyl-ACP methyl ester carboxylesterase
VPAIFVHGNPETAAVWDPLLAELERAGVSRPGLVCLSPPGFGAPLPDGFGATRAAGGLTGCHGLWLSRVSCTCRAAGAPIFW